MQNLKIAMVQTSLFWESPIDNIRMLDKKFDAIHDDVNLIVLPEMFTTGFTMNPVMLAHKMNGNVIEWLKNKSVNKNVDIVGSIIVKEEDKYYNRLIWVKNDGNLFYYDKKHLFCYSGEHKYYSTGNAKLLVDCCGWKISPFICYDLRFPIWTRNLNDAYDLALFVANWPSNRASAWKSLLVARAIENQSYVVGVNRVGVDGNGISYIGNSSIVDPNGNFIATEILCEKTIEVSISLDLLKKFRQEFPFWLDADVDLLK